MVHANSITFAAAANHPLPVVAVLIEPHQNSLTSNDPVAVIARTWLNLDMPDLANPSNTAKQRFDERLRKIVKHTPVEKPE
ncbi:MAG: hypothetical protein EON58_01910 [Alphaproteobacteria bacterium]|nr:MAG: hypothetical protein EON58_01910 [Alphaproteobacteria bacterium]